MGITAATPTEFIEKAKGIVCSHNDLQKRRGGLQEEIKRLEQEQEQLIQAKEKELLDQVIFFFIVGTVWFLKSISQNIGGKDIMEDKGILTVATYFHSATILKLQYLTGIFSHFYCSVADPGCLSRIPDPGFFPSRIPDPGSRIPKNIGR